MQLCSCTFENTGGPLVPLASSLPHLKELLFVDFWITDEVLISIATHFPHLKVLRLIRSCDRFCTEIGAQAVVTSLTRLQRFCIICSVQAITPCLRRPLRKRWQEMTPGLKISDNDLVSTRYFERMRWRY
jgi:hypothetical protein